MTAILIYHDIADPGRRDAVGFPGAAAGRYKLGPDAFRRHLESIAASGVRVGLLDGETPQAALSFDDGGASSLDIADELEDHGWRGHFFIATGRIGTPGFLAAEQVRELAARGHDVGSHSHTHPTYMGSLSRAALTDEWQRSRELLAELLGQAPRHAAVPGGFTSDAVIDQAAQAGYRRLFTSAPTLRTQRWNGLQVHGRYTIWASTSAGRAAAYARGDRRALATIWFAWQLKTGPKRVSPAAYERVRQVWARRRSLR